MAFYLYAGRLNENTIQFGEHLVIVGWLALVLMIFVLVTPLIASASWSARRVGDVG